MGTPNKGTLTDKKFPAIHNEDVKVTLLMRKVTFNSSVYVRLQQVKSAPFPSMAEPPSGNKTLFVGRFPDRVMVGLLHSDTFNGDLQRYPYASEKFGITQVRQSLNGEEYPYRILELTEDQAYEDLLRYDRFLMAMGAR